MYKETKIKIINLLKAESHTTDESLFILTSLFIAMCKSKKIDPSSVLNTLQDQTKNATIQKNSMSLN